MILTAMKLRQLKDMQTLFETDRIAITSQSNSTMIDT